MSDRYKSLISSFYTLTIFSFLFVYLFFDFQNISRFYALQTLFLIQISALVFFSAAAIFFLKKKTAHNKNILAVFIGCGVFYLVINIFINGCNEYELYKLFCAIAFFLIVAYIPIELKFEKQILFIFLILTLIWGFYQKFYGFEYIINNYGKMLDSRALARLQKARIFSVFVLPNIFASYLIMSAIYLFNKFYSADISNIKKTILYFFVLIIAFAVYYTQTVSVLISFLIAIILLLLVKKKYNFKYCILSAAIIIFVLAAVIFSRGFNEFYNNSVKHHLANYISAIKIWKQSNIFIGVGYGNFGAYYPQFMQKFGNETIYAHNYYLQILAETGLIGLFFLLSGLFLFFKFLLQNKNANNGFFLIFLFFAVNLLFSIDANVLSTLVYFAFLVGRSECAFKNF